MKINEGITNIIKNHLIENRPWGKFERFTLNEKSTVKIITLNPKKRLSLQLHKKRLEFWYFLDNPAKLTIGKKIFRAKMGDFVVVRKGFKHRVESFSKPVRFLEISFGKFDEEDIVRFEDDFGRK
ncbi:MAG: phosphomannose isomerase type II C-terminal cupin domain [Candidatus Pacearchaeota archaeon]